MFTNRTAILVVRFFYYYICTNIYNMPKRLTKEAFIERAVAIHGNKYIYNSVEYKTNRDKVLLSCLIHGDFLITPDSHLSGNGCADCAIKNRADKSRDSAGSFINKSIGAHGDIYDYSKVEYFNNKTPVVIICKKHGEFKMRPDAHISQKSGCPVCGRERTTNASVKHGLRYENTYNNWKSMMLRCYGKETPKNKCYKEKSITVELYLQDMTNYHNYVISLPNYELKEELNLTIDRIEGDKGYERGNLRWATKSEQAVNKDMVKGKYVGVGSYKNNYFFKIEFMGKKHYGAGFSTIEEAVLARNQYIIDNNLPHKIQ